MNELEKFIFSQSKKVYKKCFWSKSDCRQYLIRSHLIQNAQVLERIASKNHVYMVVPKQNLGTEPEIELALHYNRS